MRVGFIGLGSQGGPMAGRIIEAGFPTTLWARRPAALEGFADTAAKVAGSPAELAAASDLVCLCVVGRRAGCLGYRCTGERRRTCSGRAPSAGDGRWRR